MNLTSVLQRNNNNIKYYIILMSTLINVVIQLLYQRTYYATIHITYLYYGFNFYEN